MTLRATFAALSMLVAVSQPLQAQPPGLEAHKASNAYIDCLMEAARQLDDGRSAAASMGRSVQAACHDQEERWGAARTANFPAEKKRAFLEQMKAQTAAIAVQTVAQARKLKF